MINSKVPDSVDKWEQIADNYYERWNFPNCIGSLDGKHIAMRCPKNSGSMNFNYKHTFSIVLMALADANYKFIYIDVGCKGRISDGGVFNRSTLYTAIENGTLNIPSPRNLPHTNIKAPFVILADDAFALKTYLLKPFNFRDQDYSQRVFNYRLSRGRRMVESTFGIMASKFRLLRTTIEISESNVKLCVLAICALHNWLLTVDANNYLMNDRTIETPDTSNNEANEPNDDRTATDAAKRVREIFKDFFMTPAGEVHWQYDMA